MKTVVFTGATSFLGAHLLRELLREGHVVYALVRGDSTRLGQLPAGDRLHLLYGSLDDLDIVREEVSRADLWIHFAWHGSGSRNRADREVQSRNVAYSVRALQIADELGCRQFIFSGSQAEYGNKSGVIRESMECLPISEYGKAKLEFSGRAEAYCRNVQMDFIHLRIFSVYGPGDRAGTLVDDCIRKFNTGQSLVLGPCTQEWNYLYIDDFAAIVMRLIENGCASGIYNVGSDDTRVLREYVLKIYEMSNGTGTYEFGESCTNPERSPSLRPDISRLLETIGDFRMTSFEEGIRKTMDAAGMECEKA